VPEGVIFRFQICLYSIDPTVMEVERLRINKSFSEFIGAGVIAFLNRDNEISLLLSSDNF